MFKCLPVGFGWLITAQFLSALADAVCKRSLMSWMNGLKFLGAMALMYGLHPMLAFALVGLGASAYAPAKYGLLTESVAPAALVAASAPALNVSLTLVMALYLLSALCNLAIVPSGARYPARVWHPVRMMADFWQANTRLWRDRSGGLSLGVTSVFWAVGAMLQFAVLLWGVQTLGLTLDKSAFLQGIVAIGVMAGAVLVASRLRLRHATSVMPLGLLMGGLMALSVMAPSWVWAVPCLLGVGLLGGMLVVPMNALLQHRGHRLLTAGQSIAVQGFNENLSILITLLLYAGLIAMDVPVRVIMVVAGLGLMAFVGWAVWRRGRSEGLATLLRHLVRRD